MESVRLHVDGNGIVWALAKCRLCREVHKYLATDAIAGPVACKSCGHQMYIEGAVVEATQDGREKNGDVE